MTIGNSLSTIYPSWFCYGIAYEPEFSGSTTRLIVINSVGSMPDLSPTGVVYHELG